MTTKDCVWCDKPFEVTSTDPRKYCSLDCYYLRTYAAGALPSSASRETETRVCAWCQKDFRAFIFDEPKRLFCTARCASEGKRAAHVKTQRRRAHNSFRYMSWAVDEQLLKQQGKCFWCGTDINSLSCHHDHLIPLAKGGDDELYNLALTCAPCNLRKGDLMPWEFIERLNLELTVQPKGDDK